MASNTGYYSAQPYIQQQTYSNTTYHDLSTPQGHLDPDMSSELDPSRQTGLPTSSIRDDQGVDVLYPYQPVSSWTPNIPPHPPVAASTSAPHSLPSLEDIFFDLLYNDAPSVDSAPSSQKRRATGEPPDETRPTVRLRQTTPPPEVQSAFEDTMEVLGDLEPRTDNSGSPSPSTTGPSTHADTSAANRYKDASDVWYHVYAIPADILPIGSDHTKYNRNPDRAKALLSLNFEKKFMKRPSKTDYLYIGCQPCREKNICLLWKNNDGCDKHIRKHLEKIHMPLYTETVREAGLKSVHSSVPPPDERMEESSATRLPVNTYTKESFEEYLARWWYADNTAIHTLTCPDFRALLIYVGQGRISNDDIPSKIEEKYNDNIVARSHRRLKEDLVNAIGKVSFTIDDGRYVSPECDFIFQAITAHWCSKTPTGDLVIRSKLALLEHVRTPDFGLETADTLKEILGRRYALVSDKIGMITFAQLIEDEDKRQEIEMELDLGGCEHPFISFLGTLANAAEKVFMCHTQILRRAVRVVSPCLKVCDEITEKLCEAGCLHRWRRLLSIIESLLKHRPALSTMSPTITDLEGRSVNDSDWFILSSVRDLLDAFRQAETSLKSNSCKNLSNAMLVYNNLIYELLLIKAQSPLLEKAVDCAIHGFLKPNSPREDWEIDLNSDLANFLQNNDSIAISMIINPTIKMSKFPAGSGIYWKNEFLNLMSRGFVTDCPSSDYSRPESQDLAEVKAELDRYLSKDFGRYDVNFDLLNFWQKHEAIFPHIYAVALDFLPIRSAAVSATRIFLSSSEQRIDAICEGRMSLKVFEALLRETYASEGTLYEKAFADPCSGNTIIIYALLRALEDRVDSILYS